MCVELREQFSIFLRKFQFGDELTEQQRVSAMEEQSSDPTPSSENLNPDQQTDDTTMVDKDVKDMETDNPASDDITGDNDDVKSESSQATIDVTNDTAPEINSGTDASNEVPSTHDNAENSNHAAETDGEVSAMDVETITAVEDLNNSDNINPVADAENENEDQPWTDLVQQLVNSVHGSTSVAADDGDRQIVVIVGGDDTKEKVDGEHLQNGTNGNEHNMLDKMELSNSEETAEFRCWYCEETFDSNADRDEHEKLHTESKFVLLICQECGQSFRKSDEFEKHHQICGTENGEETSNKVDGDSSYSGRNAKVQSSSSKGRMMCVFCDTFFDDKDSLRKHLVLQHKMVEDNANPKMFACKFCDENLLDRVLILAHEETHKKSTRFQCSYCWKDFTNKGNLIQHERTHTVEKPLDCPHCGKKMPTHKELKNHIRCVHLSSFNRLTCEYCYVIFVTRKDLVDHLKNTHNVKNLAVSNLPSDTNYICSECGKEFDTKSKRQFDEHIATHTRDNLHSCDECGKTFVRARELGYHKARHRGEGRYICGLCKKNFVLKWDLKKHLKTVHDIDEDGSFDRKPAEKKPRLMTLVDENTVMQDIFKVNPYICRICHAQFDGGKELRMHRKTHAEDDDANEATSQELASFPFICSFCSKGFQNKGDFVEHVGQHTKGTAGHTTFPLIAPKPGQSVSTVAKMIANKQISPTGGLYAVNVNTRPKKVLEKGEGINFWRCCFTSCRRLTRRYTSKEEFETHIKGHMTKDGSVCHFCGRCFSRARDLAYHKKGSGVRPCKYMDVKPQLEEDEDDEASTSQGSNASVSLEAASHQCGCGKLFVGFKEFQLHVLSHKSTKDNMFCQYCGRNFPGQSELQEHLKENSSDPCDYASGKEVTVRIVSNGDKGSTPKKVKNAADKNVVVVPVNDDTDSQPDLPYTVISNMSPHSDKPYSCRYCGKSFRGRSYLREHETLHTKEAPYPCNQCDRRFTRARELRYHQRKHDGHEPFECDACDKRFVTKANYRAHLETVHEKKLEGDIEPEDTSIDDNSNSNSLGSSAFKCSFCSKHFNLLDHFKAHMEIVHDVEVSVVTPDEINDPQTPVLKG